MFSYEISVCSSLASNATRCSDPNTPDTHDAAVCQIQTSSGSGDKHFKLGEANTTLVYEDGSLKLQYGNGQPCHSGGHRNSTILFICDSSAHVATVSDVTEDQCEYVIEVRTKLACPPAVRASECVFFNGNMSYDFSDLSRSPYQGNWEAQGPNGSVFYINVCQPLNQMVGCSVLSGVCKQTSDSDGHVTYTNLGPAYGAKFEYKLWKGEERIVLTYQNTNTVVGPLQENACPKVEAVFELVCNKSAYTSEVMFMLCSVLLLCSGVVCCLFVVVSCFVAQCCCVQLLLLLLLLYMFIVVFRCCLLFLLFLVCSYMFIVMMPIVLL